MKKTCTCGAECEEARICVCDCKADECQDKGEIIVRRYPKEMILVSACLVGVNCKYSGKNNYNDKILKLVQEGEAVLVCPEQLGGLTTPRPPAEIRSGRVYANDGMDVTAQFNAGAQETLKIAKLYDCKKAILKSKSPSCGCHKIYDGSFSDILIDGDGITTKLLKGNGIEVISSDDYK